MFYSIQWTECCVQQMAIYIILLQLIWIDERRKKNKGHAPTRPRHHLVHKARSSARNKVISCSVHRITHIVYETTFHRQFNNKKKVVALLNNKNNQAVLKCSTRKHSMLSSHVNNFQYHRVNSQEHTADSDKDRTSNVQAQVVEREDGHIHI